jgi:hypothetical protein
MTRFTHALLIAGCAVMVMASARAGKRPRRAPPATTTTTTPSTTAAVATPAPDLALKAPHALPGGETRCILCHSVNGWDDVRFAHDRTGFPLKGLHKKTSCKSCHPSGFAKAVPDRCSGCHRDPHAEEFGLRCEGCHDEESWRTRFTADAHRRGNFPLSGRHALIPCTECHPNVRDRSFARAAVECSSCHLPDYQRTVMTSIDHMAANFPLTCQQCHNSWRWSPAAFGDHDKCFSITRGPHAGIRCLSCHTTITSVAVTGACMTNTAACTGCHEHECARSDARHQGVMGYQCKDRKCYECHHF